MSEEAKTLMQAVMELPDVERIAFASALMRSLPWEPGEVEVSEDDAVLEKVLRERLDDHLSGRDPGVPGDDVFRELREHRP